MPNNLMFKPKKISTWKRKQKNRRKFRLNLSRLLLKLLTIPPTPQLNPRPIKIRLKKLTEPLLFLRPKMLLLLKTPLPIILSLQTQLLTSL